MICAADTVGVFQIESRAQMTMLPRLRPRCFYDLVIEVAIVRPGPIQGDMVHPYLRRRNGEEPVTYPDERVKNVLGKTLGVPLFQEQVMSIAIVGAGFAPGEADRLRRAMAAWKRKGDKLQQFRTRFITGMLQRGYERDFAQRCFRQIEGFSEYGFPESHAASFALLVYVSAWLKRHHPAAFAAALINSQPMGFYAPAQIVRDAREHGVEVRPVDVNRSGWDCSVEEGKKRRSHEEMERRSGEVIDRILPATGPHTSSLRDFVSPSLRLGMRLVKGLRREDAEAIAGAVKRDGPFDSIRALRRASGVSIATLRRLAAADAFTSMGLDRQRALWEIGALPEKELPMFEDEPAAGDAASRQLNLPHIPGARQVVHDYASLRLSLKAHPMSFLRDELRAMRITEAGELKDESRWPQGKSIAVAGLVLVRQRPATANGIVFMTLEDETGIANLIVQREIYQRYRPVARHGVIILARGRVERQGAVVHVHVRSLAGLDERMEALAARARNFR
jgi:error-prone DNA polymerase